MEHSQPVIAGIRTPVITAGPSESAEAVVFVHGNPGSAEDWADLAAQVGGFARAIAMDMPGFGRADKPAGFDYSVFGYAAHLDQVMTALGVERAHLVLHDFGGPWGLAWAALNPGRFASVTLIDTGVLIAYRWHYLARIWGTPVLGEAAMAATTPLVLRTLLRHGNPRGLPRAFVDRMYDGFDAGTKNAVLRLYRATPDPGADSIDLHRALKPLNRPALVVWGVHDPYIPVRYAHRQQATFPRAKVVLLQDSGHWPFADNPEAVADAVIPFLTGVVA